MYQILTKLENLITVKNLYIFFHFSTMKIIKYVISLLSVMILVYAQKNSGHIGTGYPGIPDLKRKMELLLGSPNPSRLVDLHRYSLIEVIQGLDNLSRKCNENIYQLVEDFLSISHITQETLSKSPIVKSKFEFLSVILIFGKHGPYKHLVKKKNLETLI